MGWLERSVSAIRDIFRVFLKREREAHDPSAHSYMKEH